MNNAAIMAFGEVEWQTVSMIENQIQVNLLGTIKLTKYFLPICRKYSGRVIIVTSHCSIQVKHKTIYLCKLEQKKIKRKVEYLRVEKRMQRQSH